MEELMAKGHTKAEAQKLVSHKGSWMAGKLKVEHPYNGELMDMPEEVIRELNKDGGIRMFSFGDFRPGIDEKNVERLLADAQKRGLKVKTITKELEYIEKYHNHPNQFFINLSIDYLPKEMSNAVPYEQAVKAVQDKPKVGLRVVALNRKQALKALDDPNIEVITLYHGYTGKELWEIIKVQNPDLIKRVGKKAVMKEVNSWQDLAGPKHEKFRKMLQKKVPGRVCCVGKSCAKCPKSKCGIGNYEFAGLLPGVHLPNKIDDERKK